MCALIINQYKSVFLLVTKMMNVVVVIILFGTVCHAQKLHNKGSEKSVAKKEIHFTLGINLNFPDNISRRLEVADNDSIYYDQAI